MLRFSPPESPKGAGRGGRAIYWPAALAGSAFLVAHATIHLGWALDAKSRWMAIEGLAYLAFSYVSGHPERAAPAGDDSDLAGEIRGPSIG